MVTVLVKNADRMMTAATARNDGIELTFADGATGVVPFADIPEIQGGLPLKSIELPDSYEAVIEDSRGHRIEIPWDFARHYCDPSYRPRVEAVAAASRGALGERIREAREAAGMTQQALASAAGIGRVTLVRIEKGDQSPRYETLATISKALGRPFSELVA